VLNHGAQLNNFYWNISVAAEIRQKKDKNCNNFWPSGEKEWNTFNLLPYSLVEWNYCTWLKQDIWKTKLCINFFQKIVLNFEKKESVLSFIGSNFSWWHRHFLMLMETIFGGSKARFSFWLIAKLKRMKTRDVGCEEQKKFHSW
jgi:hypothetical protein